MLSKYDKHTCNLGVSLYLFNFFYILGAFLMKQYSADVC